MRLADVAKKAKTSISTVSRVVNGHAAVKASTRKRVMAVIEQTGYYPNLETRSLVAGSSKTIGVIVSNLENPFFVDIFHALESTAHEQGYEVLVANTNYRPERLTSSVSEKPLFSMGQTHKLLVEKVSGQAVLTILAPDPKHNENPCAVPDMVKVEVRDGVAVIKVPLFPGKLGIAFARDLSKAFEAHVNGVDRVVVDLRGNPGGGVGCLRLMSLLTPDKKPVGFSVDRNLAVRGYDKSKLPRFDHVPKSKMEVPWLALRFAGKKSVALVTEGLGRRAFHGRVVVLVNEHTTCASEMVALFAREETGAKVVGMATPGRLVTHTGFKIGHGFTLALPIAGYLSWAGTRLDGSGLTPETVVDWSYPERRRGLDSQRLAGIAMARTL